MCLFTYLPTLYWILMFLRSQDTPEGRTLFVCNLPSDNVAESEDFLKQAFSKFGAIQSVKVDTPKEEGNQGASNLRWVLLYDLVLLLSTHYPIW